MATAQATRLVVTAGPSQSDLLVFALGERREVEFTFKEVGKCKAFVTSVKSTGTHRVTAKWFIEGYFAAVGRTQRQNFSGEFNTHDRSGRFWVYPGCAACGHNLEADGSCLPCLSERACSTCCCQPEECECGAYGPAPY